MFFLNHIWVIPLLPALGAALMFFFGRKLSKSAVNFFCVGAVVVAFAFSCFTVLQYTGWAARAQSSAVREDRAESWAAGFGMNGRGIMELVIANVALSNGFIERQLFTILVLMAVVTTLVTPLLLKWAFSKMPATSP